MFKHWEELGAEQVPGGARLACCRERGAKVSQLLRQGEPAEALQMLFDNPKLAWQKDEFSGGYPIHVAAWHVSGASLRIARCALWAGCNGGRGIGVWIAWQQHQ